MPIKYVQTLGAVAGYEQVVNEVVITCQKPSEFVVKDQYTTFYHPLDGPDSQRAARSVIL